MVDIGERVAREPKLNIKTHWLGSSGKAVALRWRSALFRAGA
jgi:hypothetical protein